MHRLILDTLAKPLKYLVIGDLMLDRYIIGQVNRISPEAPVPVLKVESQKNSAGGAANVAANLAALNAQVTLLGYAGNDQARLTLDKIMANKKIQLDTTEWNRGTITKSRLVCNRQQIARFDDEMDEEPDENDRQALEQLVVKQDFSSFSGIILSDYAKGVCTASLCSLVMDKANDHNLPVFIDPKSRDWTKYKGATILTPNMRELSDAIGHTIQNEDDKVEEAGQLLLERFALKNIIVTRSASGMTLVSRNSVKHFPTMARDVFDVSGAGDTVLACLTRFMPTQTGLTDAIHIANLAAGVVVSHAGTYPISKEELLQAAASHNTGTVEQLKARGKKIVFTNGCFDMLHRGHLEYLRESRNLGDCLVVGLNSDESVKRLKGAQRPINNQQDRKKMLESLQFVDLVEIFDEDTPYELIKRIAPDILVKGGDYRPEDIVGHEFAGLTTTIPFLKGYSTTSTLEKIKNHV